MSKANRNAALFGVIAALAAPAARATSPLGPEFQVNTYTASPQVQPEVASDGTGRFVVVWESVGSPGADNSMTSVQGQRYVADGTPLGGQFQVNTFAAGNQYNPSVSASAAGDFVVVWTSSGSAGSDQSGTSIQGQRYSADGTPAGSEFQVNSFTANDQIRPTVACDAAGNFVVTWESNGSPESDQSSTSIQGQRYSAGGTPQGGQFQVNSFTSGEQRRPAVSCDAAGNFVVVWSSFGSVGPDGSDFSVQGQRYSAGGTPQGGQFQVNTYAVSTQDKSAVDHDGAGNFVVVWESRGSAGTDQSLFSIQVQRFAASGTPAGGQVQVNTSTASNQSSPCVVADASGNFVVGWNSFSSAGSDQSSTSIQIQRYAPDGSPLGGETQVNTFTTGVQSFPGAATTGGADFVVVWESAGSAGSDQSGSSIQAQRFGAGSGGCGGAIQAAKAAAPGAAASGQPAAAELAILGLGPNPSRRSVQIDFALPRAADVRVTVLDVRGRAVAALAAGRFGAGRHRAVWNGEAGNGRAAAGLYFIRLEGLGKSVVQRVVILR